MPALLFVCTANVCRSPMAVALMKAKIAKHEGNRSLKEWRVESAGTWGLNGSDMADDVKKVLQEIGIEPGSHSARTVNFEILDAFDLILTMEKGQKEAIRVEFPKVAKRVYLLSEMIGESFDIRDPIGQPIEAFRKTAQDLMRIIDEGFERIYKLMGSRKHRL